LSLQSDSDTESGALISQRLYQAITSSTPPSGPPYASTSNFASIQAGPSTARPVHSADSKVPNVTAFRVSTKLRTFVDELHYKGWVIRLADWLHLSNPDDPSRPIIGQVFKCWHSDELCVSICSSAPPLILIFQKCKEGPTWCICLLVLSP
jgi:hypothetical protein